MKYREPLPAGCPPADAAEIVARRIVYRLVRSDPPTFDDFRSQREENPGAEFRGVDECQARGVSVFITIEDADKRRERPRLSETLICEVVLDKGAGRIHQKKPNSPHCTWWPLADYDIIENCRVLE